MSRPNWRSDLKWILALLCLVCALASGVLYSFRTITDHDTATGLFTGTLGGYAAGHVSDEAWQQIYAAAAANPEAEAQLPGLLVPVKGSELAGLTKDQAVRLVASRVAEVNYEQGPDAAEALIQLQNEDGEAFKLGPLTILTRANHEALSPYFYGALIATTMLGALLVLFSRGFGRVGGPAVIGALTTAPLALVWTFINAQTEGANPEGEFAKALVDAMAGPSSDVASFFTRAAVITGGLVAIAVAGHFLAEPARRGIVAWRIWRNEVRERKAAATPIAQAPPQETPTVPDGEGPRSAWTMPARWSEPES